MPAYFRCTFADIKNFSDDSILGSLAAGYDDDGFYELKTDAIASWRGELPILRRVINTTIQQNHSSSQWNLLIEYPIPRLGKRIDAILICDSVIVVLEFKSSAGSAGSAKTQVLDYAYDLRDFHKESWEQKILPLVVAPYLTSSGSVDFLGKQLHSVLELNEAGLQSTLTGVAQVQGSPGGSIDAIRWDRCLYTPTPTIVSAAQHLYAQNSVEEIMRASAGTDALKRTSDAVLEVIKSAQQQKEKVICFVTGVPGSGKTLVGLDIANRDNIDTARFMSGNIPLIYVLREALARDLHKHGTPKSEASRLMNDRIQNIHHYTKDHFKDEEQRPPKMETSSSMMKLNARGMPHKTNEKITLITPNQK